jgi:hypothetical protein
MSESLFSLSGSRKSKGNRNLKSSNETPQHEAETASSYFDHDKDG